MQEVKQHAWSVLLRWYLLLAMPDLPRYDTSLKRLEEMMDGNVITDEITIGTNLSTLSVPSFHQEIQAALSITAAILSSLGNAGKIHCKIL